MPDGTMTRVPSRAAPFWPVAAPAAVQVLGRPGRVEVHESAVASSPQFPPVLPGGMVIEDVGMGSVIKKRRKRMAKKKHRKLLRKTRVARRKAGK